MDARPGSRVRVRGLIWAVLEADRGEDRDRLLLRCAEGDMAGLELDVFTPPEPVEIVSAALDPRRLSPLSLWRLKHRAHLLNQLPANDAFLARDPGRLRAEPYQRVPLMRALDMPRARLMLADGVGLGKTIQAGLIAAELLARRRAHRILILAPSGPLLIQWEREMRLRFGLRFTFLTSAADMRAVRRAHERGANPFEQVGFCLTSFDFAKQDHVLEELERSTWDLVIIDEAHHCMGPSAREQPTHRRRLAEVLARCSDGLLLLTATPHDGDEARFASLIALLDPALVDGMGGFVGDAYRRHVIRRLKAHIRDPRTGRPLFRRRHVIPVKVDAAGPEHEPARDFHRALSAFVVPRLRRPEGEGDALAFIGVLKRSVSTIAACLATLHVVADRIARCEADQSETRAARAERLRAARVLRHRAARFGSLSVAGEADLEILDIESMAAVLRAEPADSLARLIALGEAALSHDPKLTALLLEVRLIRMARPGANILIYTEYTDSQTAAARVLRDIGGEVLTIGGQDSDEARVAAADRFSEDEGLILLSTDALAEGLNLQQRCFHLIHLDLPYNPNRLEQRNGRIDRHGQRHEPEIRYLYLPGTFEESILLNLIAKYEKARSSLDVMPDTLGVTADPDDYDKPLTGGLSEEPDDLFKSRIETLRALDRTAEDSRPDQVAALLREIDRAFDGFDLMAVRHGWYSGRGINADVPLPAPWDHSENFPDFARAVIAAETGEAETAENEIRLPRGWDIGLETLPGFDAARGVLRFTRDPETWRDTHGRPLGYLGRAHPLVRHAIRQGCRLPGETAVAAAGRTGLLLTYEMEAALAHRAVFRRVIAVLLTPGHPPVEKSMEKDDWLSLGAPVNQTDPWSRYFADWADPARGEALAMDIMAREHAAFLERFTKERDARTTLLHRWLRVRADILCGEFVASTGDLFGAPEQGASWRREENPHARLAAFATDPDVPAARRGEASDTLTLFQAAENTMIKPGAFVSRPIGMLMLVPADGC